MKFLFYACLVLSLASCGYIDRSLSTITGSASKICVDGVTYLQFTSGATVQLDKTGKLVQC